MMAALSPGIETSVNRGTFSRAGGPRIKRNNDIIDKMSSHSLYMKISDQNNSANRNNCLPSRQRQAISQSFKSAQSTFRRCNALNEVAKYGISMGDVNFDNFSYSNENFRRRSVPKTNDGSLYMDPIFTKMAASYGPNNTGYVFRGANNDIRNIGSNDITQLY